MKQKLVQVQTGIPKVERISNPGFDETGKMIITFEINQDVQLDDSKFKLFADVGEPESMREFQEYWGLDSEELVDWLNRNYQPEEEVEFDVPKPQE